MPRLNDYISVGFCSGYGDGDWRISTSVESLSRRSMEELMLAMFHAQRAAWEMWSAAQPKEQAAAAAPTPETGGTA